jgi:hypothetical protein
VTSTDGGSTWSGPTQVDPGATDQWLPWVDVNPTNGTAGILYNDREAANASLYAAALRELPGSKTIVSTAPSHPTQSRFFRAGVTGCENCATFHGDYDQQACGGGRLRPASSASSSRATSRDWWRRRAATTSPSPSTRTKPGGCWMKTSRRTNA